MKLLLVTSLKEYQKTIVDIMDRAGIGVFSLSETVGFKDHLKQVALDNWFSSGGAQADSIFLFTFTDAPKADTALELINAHNGETKSDFPIRAFIVPVEKSSYDHQVVNQQQKQQ
jgi:hypothetical protein